jgi:hypothetical protein
MEKEGAHSPIPKISTKTFSPYLTLEMQTKLVYYFSGRKTLQMGKSASFLGFIQSFAQQKSNTWNPCIKFFVQNFSG